MWIELGNTVARVTRASDSEREWLAGFLSFEDNAARFRRRYARGGDGQIHLFSRLGNTFPAGLLRLVRKEAGNAGITVDVADKRTQPSAPPNPAADLSWLRPYQVPAVHRVRDEHRGILWLPTGAGKTEVFVGCALMMPCRWLFLVHKRDLMHQTAERWTTRTGQAAGLVGDNEWSDFTDGHRIVIATFQTLAAAHKRGDRRASALLAAAEGLCVDECFPAGTPVGGVAIETLRTDDLVPSFAPDGTPVMRRVVRTMARRPSALVAVNLGDGRRIACTPNHRFWTRTGWVAAAELTSGQNVLCLSHAQAISMRTVRSNGARLDDANAVHTVLPAMSGSQKGGTTEDGHDDMRDLRCDADADGTCGVGTRAAAAHVLLDGVSRHGDVREQPAHGGARRGAIGCADARTQPDRDARGRREDQDVAGRDMETPTQGCGQPRTDADAVGDAGSARERVGAGAPRQARPGEGRVPSGRRTPAEEDRRGTGRPKPLRGEEEARRVAGCPTAWVGVDRVEVLEPGSDGTFSGMCPDGHVYNIEVEDTHSYFADGVGVSNCHVLPAGSFYGIAQNCPAFYRVGMSGTPLARGDRRSILAVAALGPVLYRVRTDALVEAGVLARPKIRLIPLDQTSDCPTWQGVYGECVVRSPKRNRLLITMARKAAKPCLLFCKEIAHGRELLRRLTAAGVRAEFVWGTAETPQRRAAVKRLERGDIDVLVCSAIFQEGVDIPNLASVVIGSGGKSTIAALQRIGRAMRTDEGRKMTMEVWDVLDRGNSWLEKQARARARAYAAEGHETVVEGPQLDLAP